jgi:hypothetical protein
MLSQTDMRSWRQTELADLTDGEDHEQSGLQIRSCSHHQRRSESFGGHASDLARLPGAGIALLGRAVLSGSGSVGLNFGM